MEPCVFVLMTLETETEIETEIELEREPLWSFSILRMSTVTVTVTICSLNSRVLVCGAPSPGIFLSYGHRLATVSLLFLASVSVTFSFHIPSLM
jgi:hypothetical protein